MLEFKIGALVYTVCILYVSLSVLVYSLADEEVKFGCKYYWLKNCLQDRAIMEGIYTIAISR